MTDLEAMSLAACVFFWVACFVHNESRLISWQR